MTTREDILERLAYADALSYGPKASALIAEAVTWADALGEEDLQVVTRLALTDGYQHGNEEWKALAPFVWNLARYKERPDLFDADQVRTLHWHFKWSVAVAAANPKVAKDQVRQLEASLEEFYRSEGASMHVVHGERASVAGLLGLEEEAAEELAAWRATPRDENSDCEGCDPMRQVAFAYRTEDWELAVGTAVPILREDVGCRVQPQMMQSLVLLPLLASGRPKAAWDAHLRSYREIRRHPNALVSIGYHLEYLALVGKIDRGLDILRRHISWLDQAESAHALLGALRGMSLVLREAERFGRGEEALGVVVPAETLWAPQPTLAAETTISQAYAEFSGWARRLAASFDARNGNTTISDHLERSLARASFAEHADAGTRVELLETPEELPEAVPTCQPVEAGAGEEFGFSSALGMVSLGQEEEPGQTAGPGPLEEADEPFPLVDLTRPAPLADADDAVRRYARTLRRVGVDTEHLYIVDQAAAHSLLPEPGRAPDGLEIEASLLRANAYSRRTEYDRAIEERLRIRSMRESQVGVLGAVEIDIANLDDEMTADRQSGRDATQERAARLERAEEMLRSVASRVDALIGPERSPGASLESGSPSAEACVLAADALGNIISVLTELEAKDQALEAVALMERVWGRIPMEMHAENMRDAVDMARAEVLAECGDVFEGCQLAEEVMRRHEPMSLLVAGRGRRLLGVASMQVEQFEEAVKQFREHANMMMAAGLPFTSIGSLLNLGQALGVGERYLESAEVLESALSRAERLQVPGMILFIHQFLAQVHMGLGEHAGVLEHSLAAAEGLEAAGRVAAAKEAYTNAAMAAGNMDDNVQSSALFRRAAALEDTSTDQGRLDRGRMLRRAARALVDDFTVAMARSRLDDAVEIMEESRAAFIEVEDGGNYSSAWEMGDWHDDMSWILWRTDENSLAAEHCEAAYEGYMSKDDRESAARALCMLARLHAEREERDEALAACARVRELLAHPRWQNHDALSFVASIEESFS
ncbi:MULTISPECIES: hypothetical protein [Actinomyces]|uniref:Tetratricopeptide repeat protein n=2 Tax=Actinomyces TaxID=1654 RepID=A0A853EJ71_9ACTO|nr:MULTISPECIES: hypothetical protein [Actinomyces]MBF0697175.1 hypothetical protein [Actinomyces bowdenii]NYS69348.1 hypothetical protein [Actinomyces bowdenii]BDA64459.1 hypothetical protein MANAM107_12930 [Actinomyces capricornis]